MAVGRPKASFSDDEIVRLRGEGCSLRNIAIQLGTSVNTVKRRIRDMGIQNQDRNAFTEEQNRALEAAVSDILFRHPKIGFTLLRGHARSMGLDASRNRLWKAYQKVRNTAGTRPHGRLKRRVYKVRAPLSLVHIDGNHKLIRWKFVIHGAIDGYSRLITFMNVGGNNKASTVFGLFLRSVVQWGIPSRVRTDYGGENIRVAEYMNEKRGMGRGSFIAGKSVHNIRIERLWVDVNNSFSSSFRDLFLNMEDDRILNVDDEMDLAALHYVFLPLLRQLCEEFVNAYNHKPTRTTRSKSPLELYHEGLDQLSVQAAGFPDKSFAELSQPLRWLIEAEECLKTLPVNSADEDPLITSEVPCLLNDPRFSELQARFPRVAITLENAVETYTGLKTWLQTVT